MIVLRGVSKYYSQGGIVSTGFSKVDLELHNGEFVAITGESGSGKSTLLNVISGLDSYEEGEMTVMGEPTSGFSKEDLETYRKRYIGNIFQSFNLVGSYNVYQNVELILLLNGYKGREVKERVDEIIKRVGLWDLRNQKASKLSGGQKQRVAIARALAKESPIIVADEPTGNLDSKSAEGIVQLLREIARDKLVIIVTHNYEQVAPYVTRKITMYDGAIAEDKVIARDDDTEGANEAKADASLQSGETVGKGNNDEVNDQVNQEPQAPVIGHLGLLSGIRLALRNTFNIPTKLILLILVFTFLATGVTLEYAGDKEQSDNIDSFGFNWNFPYSSPERVIAKKTDGTAFVQEDYDKLAKIQGVKEVVPKAYLVDCDINVVASGGMIMTATLSPYTYETYPDIPEEERPTGFGEFYAYYTTKTMDEESMIAVKDNFKGIEAHTESILPDGQMIKGFTTMDEDIEYKVIGNSFKGADMILVTNKETLDAIATGVGKTGDSEFIRFYTGGLYVANLNVKASKQVPQGEIYIPSTLDDMRDKSKGKVLNIEDQNPHVARSQDFTITKVFSEKKTQDLFSPEEYELNGNTVFISWEDYTSLFARGDYQVTLKTDNLKDSKAIVPMLEKEGYSGFVVAESISKQFGLMTVVFELLTDFVIILLFIGIFYICYFVVSLIMKSRNVYFATIRMIGATMANCKWLIRGELFVVFNIAYGITLGLVECVRREYIHVEFIKNAINQLMTRDFVILYGIIFVIIWLIAGRYAKKMFKLTAMNAHREEA